MNYLIYKEDKKINWIEPIPPNYKDIWDETLEVEELPRYNYETQKLDLKPIKTLNEKKEEIDTFELIVIDIPKNELEEIARQNQIRETEQKIQEQKDILSSTDWAVVKSIEQGITLKEKYPSISEQREQARLEINKLEVQLE